MLDDSRLHDDEYEKQYYGFSSTELYADFKEQTCKAIKTALTEIDTAMKTNGYNDARRAQKMEEYYSLYMESSKKPLDKFKNEVEKIFAIPKNVVFNEDQSKIEHYTDEDILKLKKEVIDLEKELLREQVFVAMCKQQKEIIDTQFKPTYERMNSLIKSLKNVLKTQETDNNKRKLLDLHEQHVQYYFGNNDNEENVPLQLEKDFFTNTNHAPFTEW